MKKFILLTVMSLFAVISSAQITITHYDILNIGEYAVMNHDTIPSTALVPGSAGPNQTWNFSALGTSSKDTIGVVDPSTTAYYTYFPNANMCGKDTSDGGFYFRKTPQFFTVEGFAANIDYQGVNTLLVSPFQPADTIVKFPLNYLDWGISNYIEIDHSMYYGQLVSGFMVDSVRYKSVVKKSYVMDAWGDITTPIATYSALRQNMQEVRIDTIWGFTLGNWIKIDDSNDTTRYYNWYAKEMGLQLVEMEWDENTNEAISVNWVSASTHDVVAEMQKHSLNIYPNPTSDYVQIDFEEKTSGLVRIYDIRSALIYEEKIEGKKSMSINTSNFDCGVYFIRFIDENNKQYINKMLKK